MIRVMNFWFDKRVEFSDCLRNCQIFENVSTSCRFRIMRSGLIWHGNYVTDGLVGTA